MQMLEAYVGLVVVVVVVVLLLVLAMGVNLAVGKVQVIVVLKSVIFCERLWHQS
jgi:hypothetical protein